MRKSTIVGRLAFLFVVGMLGVNALATALTTYASIHNYPGGTALAQLNTIYASSPNGPYITLYLCLG